MMLQFYYISKKQNDDLRGMATRGLYVVRHQKIMLDSVLFRDRTLMIEMEMTAILGNTKSRYNILTIFFSHRYKVCSFTATRSNIIRVSLATLVLQK